MTAPSPTGTSRTSTLLDTGKPSMATNARYSLPVGYDGSNGGPPKPASGPLPHINDLLAIPRDIDPNQSIKKLLDMAEASLRQSEMSRDFNRPAFALRDYIRAYIIAVQSIRSHRDYPSLKESRKDLAQAHNALLKRIDQQDSIYAKVKQDIIADNARSGVKPTVQRPGSSQGGAPAPRPTSSESERQTPPAPAKSNGSAVNISPVKSKPAVHAKPQALHGNAIKAAPGRNGVVGNATQDLAARFANLRGPQVSPGQDPRIKTHPILPPQPSGPRDMPPPQTLPQQKPKLAIDSSISSVPSLPKMPDAIYSPARGNVSTEAARPPTSTPRGVYARTGSSASIASTPSLPRHSQSNDYFSSTQSYSETSSAVVSLESSLKVSSGDTITPEQLYQAMKGKGSILIIDIRVREDFDEGHILSSSTICIEPSILIRENISSDQISESLVLSPGQEQACFDQRDKYELVVFYDQDSEQIPKSPRNSDDLVVISLHRALVHFNYGKELKNAPQILKGGLDAWVDLMGPASLQSTAPPNSNSSRPGPNRGHNIRIERRRSKFVVKPLKPDDVRAWQEMLKNDDMKTASSPAILRTTEDFLRRFPPVSPDQQSMTSPVAAKKGPPYASPQKLDFFSDLPSPPTRPAPALPRHSHSGLSHEPEAHDAYNEASAAGEVTKFYTGLNNPRNWCYANSTLQSLFGSPGFGRELADSEWEVKYKAPRKDDEKDNPQLMIRIISNLFHWMSTGKLQVMKAQTLMDYSRHLCNQSRTYEQFGGTQQQDAQEFMSFLLTHLHDETNTRRDRKGQVDQPNTKDQSLLQAASEYWRNHIVVNQSIVDRYWRGVELSRVQCLECHTRTHQFSAFELIPVTVNLGSGASLDQVLTQHTADNTLDDFSCDHCQRPTRAVQSLSFARLPLLVCVVFRRFHYQQSTADLKKSTAPITWDFNDCDMSPYFLQGSDCTHDGEVSDKGFTGPFRYECYAVIVHSGSRTDNGHYYAYVRDTSTHDPYAWLCCNDSRVTRVRIGSGDRDDIQNQVFKTGKDCVPYLVFFQRKGMH